MQDNPPKHKAKILQKWFRDQKGPGLDCPAQSPDINPNEHLWGHLKRQIGNFKPPNKEALCQKVQREWYAKIVFMKFQRFVSNIFSRVKNEN